MRARAGQHFLKNKEKLKEIAESLGIKKNDLIIEIGAGHGELTESLIKEKNLDFKITAIEKDKKLSQFLKNKFKDKNNIEIVQGDALKKIKNQISIQNHKGSGSPSTLKWYRAKIKNRNQFGPKIIKKLKVVGNIPYYITGRLLRILSELELKPSLIVLTIQKEVAERITAKPPKMNLLAASVQFWAKPKIIDYIPKKDFYPQPKVDSAILRLTTNNRQQTANNKQLTINYYKLIKILFKQPRKTILNNLRAGLDKDKKEIKKILLKNKISPNVRASSLNLEQIKNLSTILF